MTPIKGGRNILIFVAHSDDQVLGPGGTIASFAKEGYAVYTIICSFGEFSHPHLKPEVIRKTRVQEAQRADKILGGAGVSFLGLIEGKFEESIAKDGDRLMKNLGKRLKELKPERIFYHDPADTHPDHMAAARILRESLRRSRIKTELYTFALYRPRGKRPLFFVDTTDTFKLKIQALHEFRSQIGLFTHAWINNLLYAGVYLRSFFAGRKMGVRYAESFQKVNP
jgi:LmbE family N-acetylglucosaminyl deacetylase